MTGASLRERVLSPTATEPSFTVSAHAGDAPLRVLSLFAGIGGFDLGLERTGGFKTIAVAETDAYASKVLAKRFPDAPNVGDVTTAEYPHADIICAGFPCQDISFAGAGAGLAGARSGLWREVVRAIRVVRPQYAIMENVAALLSRGMGTVLGDLAEERHDAEWHCIPAAAVGAPHIRDRVWIVAEPQHPDSDRTGSYRAEEHDGRSERGNKQGRVVGSLGALLADSARKRGDWSRPGATETGRHEPANGGEVVADADADGAGLAERELQPGGEGGAQRPLAGQVPALGGRWPAEPDVGRVAHGIPKRVDRLRCLGNAVVPQIPELIGRAILAALAEQRRAA